MMMVIPTVQVLVQPEQSGDLPMVFRVPQTDLETFLHVLFFNGIYDIVVKPIKNHDHTESLRQILSNPMGEGGQDVAG